MSEFVDRLLNALGGRVDKLKGIWNEPVGVDPSRPVRMLGQVAGGAGDVLGEVMRSAYTNLVPQSSQDRFSSAVSQMAQTPVGRFVGDTLSGALNAYRGFSEKNPKIAGSLDALANLSDFTPKGLAHAMIPFMGEIRGLKHGSGYKFDKFSDEFIGKGEGAQAFGKGHYLTEDDNVARNYAESAVNQKGLSLQSAHNVMTTFNNGDYEALMAYAKSEMEGAIRMGAPNEAKSWGEIYNSVSGDNPKLPKWLSSHGNVYDVTVNKGKPSTEDIFLEWSKPFNDQNDKVKDALSILEKEYKDPEVALRAFLDTDFARQFPNSHEVVKARKILEGVDYDVQIDGKEWLDSEIKKGDKSSFFNILGGDHAGAFYSRLSSVLGGEDEAKKYLSSFGITGIKYPSGTLSGIKDSPYSNYVIFDPNNITIEGVRSR